VTALLEQLPLIPEHPPTLGDMALVAVDRFPPDDRLEGEPDPKLVESIRRWGVLDPVVVRAVGGALDYANPRTLVSGRRRIKAVRLLVAEAKAAMERLRKTVPAGTVLTDETLPGWRRAYERFRDLQKVPVRVVSDPEGTLDDGRTEALLVMTNAVRRDNPAADFRALSFLLEKLTREGRTEKAALSEAAVITGLAPGTIKQRLRLRDLSPDLQDDFLAGALPYTVALQASRLGAESQAVFAQMVDDGEPPTLELVKQAKRDTVKAMQATMLDSLHLADLPPAAPAASGAPAAPGDLHQRARLLLVQLAQTDLPILREASAVIEALLREVEQ
jgi:hypothetical protein